MTTRLLLIGAILCEVTATLSLKAALDRPLLYVVVAAGFLSAFVLLAEVLRRGMPLGVAYGVWGASGVVATSILSAAIFDEQVTFAMGVGLVLIVAGVLLVELGSHAAPDHPLNAERETA